MARIELVELTNIRGIWNRKEKDALSVCIVEIILKNLITYKQLVLKIYE